MLVFTGSDWCVWCKKLDQDILKKPEFLAWSNMNVAKVEIDFPQNSVLPTEIASQNDALMAKYGQHVQTFPTVLFVDSKGTVLAKTGYINSDVNNWIDNAKQILPETKFAAQSGNDVIGQFVGN
jgi:protein disulfide-isomerase